MPIAVLRTGPTPERLRAWEMRDRVVSPVRSDGRKRLYLEAGGERGALPARAVGAGLAVGPDARLTSSVIATLDSPDAQRAAALPGAANDGWRVVYLAANLPVAEIAATARLSGAYAAALSLLYLTVDPAMPAALRELHTTLPTGTVILAGGSAVASNRVALVAVGAATFGSIGALRRWPGKVARTA